MTDKERFEKLEAITTKIETELAALRKLVEHLAFKGATTRGNDGKLMPATWQTGPLGCNGNPMVHHYAGPDGRCVCGSYSGSFVGSQ